MILIPPSTLLRIAALPKAVVAEVLSIFADFLSMFEVPQNHSNDAQPPKVDAQKHSTLSTFDAQEPAELSTFDAQKNASCELLQVPKVSSEVPPKSNIKPLPNLLPNPPGYIVKSPAREVQFELFWRAYPKHINKQAAFRKFDALLKTLEAAHLIEGAKAYAKATQATEKQFIKSPDVWLNKGCYDDELPLTNGVDHPISGHVASVLVKHDTPQWEAWEAHYRKVKGKPPPTHNGGWHFPTEWPPNEG